MFRNREDATLQLANRALDLLDIELDHDLFPRRPGPPESRSTGGTGPTHIPPPAGGRVSGPLSSDDVSANRRACDRPANGKEG